MIHIIILVQASLSLSPDQQEILISCAEHFILKMIYFLEITLHFAANEKYYKMAQN